jgi:hypothetical protein
MTSGGESRRLFEAYASRSPAQPLFQAAVGNLNRRSPTAMGTQNPIVVRCFDFWSKGLVPAVSPLLRVLTETVARQGSGVIGADRLPPECRSVTRREFDPNGGPGARRTCPVACTTTAATRRRRHAPWQCHGPASTAR